MTWFAVKRQITSISTYLLGDTAKNKYNVPGIVEREQLGSQLKKMRNIFACPLIVSDALFIEPLLC